MIESAVASEFLPRLRGRRRAIPCHPGQMRSMRAGTQGRGANRHVYDPWVPDTRCARSGMTAARIPVA
jgi:hypothetical protein